MTHPGTAHSHQPKTAKHHTMRIQNLLALAVGLGLVSCPLTRTFAQDQPAKAEKKVEKKAENPPDPEKQKFNAARGKAMADPDVKAAMDASRKAMAEANLKLYTKMKEIDPSLAEKLDKEIETLKTKMAEPTKVKKEGAPKPEAKPKG